MLIVSGTSFLTFLLIYYLSKKQRPLDRYDLGRVSATLELFPELRKRIEVSGTMSDFEWWGLLEIESRFNRRMS
jgi:hypothetical protein